MKASKSSSSGSLGEAFSGLDFIRNFHRPHLSEVRSESGTCLSPHGALRAYTVLLTAEPRRGSLPAELHQYRTLSDSSDWSDLSDRSDSSLRLYFGVTSSVSGTDRTSPRCEWWWVAILSPHGALRAYTVFLTAEPRRRSSMELFS